MSLVLKLNWFIQEIETWYRLAKKEKEKKMILIGLGKYKIFDPQCLVAKRLYNSFTHLYVQNA